jgi:hypothetical protein
VILFWVSAAALTIPWIIYPSICAIRRLSRVRHGDSLAGVLSVAAVIATRDSPEDVSRKVGNLLDRSQGADVTSLVIGVDWNAAWTVDDYAALIPDARVRVVRGPAPGGKALALNAAVEASPSSGYLLIADTHQRFEAGAIGRLVTRTAAEAWDGASGVVRPLRQGVPGRIWQRFELGIRAGQSAGRGLVTTSGAITILRRGAWIALPPGTICDDLYLSTGTALRGGKIGLCLDAVALDPRAVPPREAFLKKVRTLTGLWQYVLALEPTALSPVRNPLWFDLISHKIMRVFTPFLAVIGGVGLLMASPSLRDRVFSPLALLVVGVLAAPAVFGESQRWWLLTFMAPAIATWNALRGNWQVWNIAKATHSR